MFLHKKALNLSSGTSISSYIISSLSKPNIASFISCFTKYISYIDPALFLVYFRCCTSSCSTISSKQISQLSFYFQCNRWCSLLYFYDLQVRAGGNFLNVYTGISLMVVIIHSRFSCFMNIGYQFCKVIVVIISCKNNTYNITLCSILCNITL